MLNVTLLQRYIVIFLTYFLAGDACYTFLMQAMPAIPFFCRASPAGYYAGWRLRVTIIPNPFLFLKKGLPPLPGPSPL